MHNSLSTISSRYSKVKLSHWDPDIRSLAAKSLGQLARLDVQLSIKNLREVLVHCMSSIPNLRQGSVLAVGEIVESLVINFSSEAIPEDLITEVTQLVLKLDKGRMFR